MALVPIVILTIMGIKNNTNTNNHFYGFMVSVASMSYCIMEEYGWRGYLMEELKSTPSFIKNILIASIWYVWHLSFLQETTFPKN